MTHRKSDRNKAILTAVLTVTGTLLFIAAFVALLTETNPLKSVPRTDLYDDISALHEQGLNAWDDYDYWDKIITRDISHRVEIVCAHGVAFFLHDGQLIPMDVVSRVNFHEARDVCAKRERAKSE